MSDMESEPDDASSSKPQISTLVFMDLETTGLPGFIGKNNVHITEISLVAVDRQDFEDDKSTIRVINKLSICVQPRTTISYGAMKVTGLSNDILETQKIFDDTVPKLLEIFLSRLRRPVCLLAHNGHCYDFPILQAELNRVQCSLSEDILCADTLEAFRKLGLVPPNDTFAVPPNDTFAVLPNDTFAVPPSDSCAVDTTSEISNHLVSAANLTDEDIEKLLSEDIDLLKSFSEPHDSHLTYYYNTQSHKHSTPNCPGNQNNIHINNGQICNLNNAVEIGSGECTPIKTGISPLQDRAYYAHGNKVEITPQSDHSLSENNQEHKNISHAKRRLFTQTGNESTKKIITELPSVSTVNSPAKSTSGKKQSKRPQYSLEKLYIHYFGKIPPEGHHAESDCINLSKVCQKVSKHFLPWLDEHSFPFSSTTAMW